MAFKRGMQVNGFEAAPIFDFIQLRRRGAHSLLHSSLGNRLDFASARSVRKCGQGTSTRATATSFNQIRLSRRQFFRDSRWNLVAILQLLVCGKGFGQQSKAQAPPSFKPRDGGRGEDISSNVKRFSPGPKDSVYRRSGSKVCPVSIILHMPPRSRSAAPSGRGRVWSHDFTAHDILPCQRPHAIALDRLSITLKLSK